jgi:tetratricopeptide (TPR) repeat protein
MSLAPHDSSHADEADRALERVRAHVFAGQHRDALDVLEAQAGSDTRLETWRGMVQTFLGDTAAARLTLTGALARGERGATGPLAYLLRSAGEPRAFLESLTPADTAPLDAFAAALVERETGEWHLECERLDAALAWLERAWRTAMLGPYGRHQFASIAQPLATTLTRLGFDARAVCVLDEGLRHTNRHRRVVLLYERALRNLHLGRIDAVTDDLSELETFVPAGDPELGLLVRYAHARRLHALGATGEALIGFALVHAGAARCETARGREIALHACLWCAALETERDGTDDALWLERAEDYAAGARGHAWIALRRGRLLASTGRLEDAVRMLEWSAHDFQRLAARVEHAFAALHRADALLRLGWTREDEAGAALLEAARLATEIGGAAPLRLELRVLTHVRAYLERTPVTSALHGLLEARHAHRSVRVAAERVEVNGALAVVSGQAARLIAYLRGHPLSTWAHLRTAVFADLDEARALETFATLRADLEREIRMRVVYVARAHAYSLEWSGVSLEVVAAMAGADTPALVS